LAQANKIRNPNMIYAGGKLNIPSYNPTPQPAPQTAAPAAPQPPKQQSLDDWLAGDTTYNQQQANFNKAKADYDAQYTQQQQQTNRDYATSTRALNQQGTLDRENQMNDYAGRGIVNSGVYANALSQYNDQFNTKMNNLNQGLQDTLNNQNMARTNFLRQTQYEQDAARQDAVRRRAQSLGI
jgi:hypothetical protein